MRYDEFAAPSFLVRDPLPGEAALVVSPADVPDLLALLKKRLDHVLVERARPGPREAVMHYVQCGSALAAGRLERAWHDHRLEKVGRDGLRVLVERLNARRGR